MIKYLDLGADCQLNQIVVAGSHDAGITAGKGNAQTQNLDVGGQARAGVRIFDLRIAAFAAGTAASGSKQAELKAFHAPDKVLGVTTHVKETKPRSVIGFDGVGAIERSHLRVGTQGLGLREMLLDARNFVQSAEYSGEFLILKFDKCTNWRLIADMCRSVLGNHLYIGRGNVNTKTLAELSGQVIVAFTPEGYGTLNETERAGIVSVKNLYKPTGVYDPDFSGIQYWGKGGTSLAPKSQSGKIEENKKKQKEILSEGATIANPNVLGMMYWTTTGINSSIQERNALMWDQTNKSGIRDVWLESFSQFASYLGAALPSNVNPASYGSGGTLKMFMPNIVMLDFVDEDKCRYVYNLNRLAAVKLVEANQKLLAAFPSGPTASQQLSSLQDRIDAAARQILRR